MFKFGQIEVASKEFDKQRQITDIFTIDVNKFVVFEKVPCNNGKGHRYIIGYKVNEETIIPLFIKTPKNIFSYGVSQYDKNFAYRMSFNVFEEKEWVSQHKRIWNEVESQLFEKLATKSIKGEGKYVYGKLKTWKDCIRTNFHGQQVLYDIYCRMAAVLKIDSVYKQSKNHHPQVYVEECKYTTIEKQQHTILSDDEDNGFLEV